MKEVLLLFLLALSAYNHGVLGFVVLPPPITFSPQDTSSSSELYLFRKDGRVRTKFRRFRGMIRSKLLRRQQPAGPKVTVLEVEMRDDNESYVVNGLPMSSLPLVEEDIIVRQIPEIDRIRAKLEWDKNDPADEDSSEEESWAAEGVHDYFRNGDDEKDITTEERSWIAEEVNYETGQIEEECEHAEAEMETFSILGEDDDDLDALDEIGNSSTMEETPTAEEEDSITPDDEQQSSLLEEPVLFHEEKLIKDVDSFFASGNANLALGMLQETDATTSGTLYWRLVKAHYELFATANDKSQQQEYLEKGIALVEDAPKELKEDIRTRALLLKWKAILLGKLGSFQSTKQKMSNSFVIKESLETARQLLEVLGEEDGSIYQALGEWCFKVAGISFLERQAASMLFGKPPESTYEEAVDLFIKAYELKGTPDLAIKVSETYQKMGEQQLAAHWANKSLPTKETLLP